MEWITLAIKIFAVCFALFNVGMALFDNRKKFGYAVTIWKRFRFRIFFKIIFILFCVGATYRALISISPIFGYGWINFFMKSAGNILVTPMMEGLASDNIIIRTAPLLFLFGFLISLPFMAKLEENVFRRGVHTWGKMTLNSICFGLMHLALGIPIGAGIALIIPGFFFAHKYRQTYLSLCSKASEKEAKNKAVLVSTTYHTLMNTVVLSYLIIISILSI
ncbi:MAG: hypothetical protein WCT49_05345 [Candidatus Paceibacterota bacterium]